MRTQTKLKNVIVHVSNLMGCMSLIMALQHEYIIRFVEKTIYVAAGALTWGQQSHKRMKVSETKRTALPSGSNSV